MSYAGTSLTREQWEAALVDSRRELMAGVRGAALRPLPSRDEAAATCVAHLVHMAHVDRAYAWWAAHHYQLINPPPGATYPERLQEAMRIERESRAQTQGVSAQ